MDYKVIDQLVKQMLNSIFMYTNHASFSDYEKRLKVYEYLTHNIEFDNHALKTMKKIGHTNDLVDSILDVFIYHRGVCSSMTQVYKLLLEELGIPALSVMCLDEGDKHQIALVKTGSNWSFDDIARGSLASPENRLDNFDYDNERLPIVDQQMLGVLPEEVYDVYLGRKIKRPDFGLSIRTDGSGLYQLPENIKSTKKEIADEKNRSGIRKAI